MTVTLQSFDKLLSDRNVQLIIKAEADFDIWPALAMFEMKEVFCTETEL